MEPPVAGESVLLTYPVAWYNSVEIPTCYCLRIPSHRANIQKNCLSVTKIAKRRIFERTLYLFPSSIEIDGEDMYADSSNC